MSRTTIDDCRKLCPNHFSLAYHSARRAQEILRRGNPQVPEGDDRSIVVALREIAKGLVEVPPLSAEAPDAEAETAKAEKPPETVE
ncbi:MAG: DNA-directed RNA polymerase subunit omega [Gammaproteobacteria bacterium]